MADPQVLIVGAGPTGLVMALWLARLGVPFRIIEKHSGPGQTSRAMAVHARTLEFYRQLGFAEEVVQAGIKLERLRLRQRGRELALLNFGDFGKGLSPYPFILSFPQDEHERLLGSELRRLGAEIEWNTELVGFTAGLERIDAVVRRDGRDEICQVSFLCGCDGVHSAVRQNLKLEFPGGIYQQMFFVADVRADGIGVDGDVNFLLAPNELCLAFPIRTTGMLRLIGLVPQEMSGRENLSFQDLQAHFEELMSLRIHDVNWFSTYHVHHRVTDRFRVGRVFVAGDAGHVHSPAGGQGMNTGIGDAVNLAWKLAAVLKGNATSAILDTDEIERIAFAHSLVATTDRLFQALVGSNLAGEIVRTVLLPRVLPWLMGFSAIQRAQFRLISQTRINYRRSPISEGSVGHLRGGDRLPWVEQAHQNNFDPLMSLDWQLHVYGEASQRLRQAAQDVGIDLHQFASDQNAHEAGFERNALYLVRPDGYIAFAESSQDVQRFGDFLSKFSIGPLRNGVLP